MKKKKLHKNHHLIFLASIALIVLSFVFRDHLAQFKSLGLFGIFLVNFLGNATVFLPAPAIAFVFVGGALYPITLVALVSAIGASLGDMIGFFLGHSGKHVLFGKGEHILYNVLKAYFKRFGDLIVFVFALIPNPFFDGIGIVAGAFSYSPIRFFIILFLGRLLRDLLLASLGASFK